ncbi:hypothetical protein CHUAL_008197 [Chamberlinius hualienensis]
MREVVKKNGFKWQPFLPSTRLFLLRRHQLPSSYVTHQRTLNRFHFPPYFFFFFFLHLIILKLSRKETAELPLIKVSVYTATSTIYVTSESWNKGFKFKT